MAEGAEGSAGLIGKVEAGLEGTMDFSSSATSTAQGGKISNGAIFNSSGGSFGLVKTLAFAGVALLALKILRKK